jgi:ubiquinone/menaquinone biosynthesis C-methylase UbiE
MLIDFPWPIPPGCSQEPVWTGSGFQVGQTLVPVLSYEVGTSGWTDELTSFHEESAGSAHFIDRASRQRALDQLDQHVKTEAPVLLEIGCSSGFMLHDIRQRLPHARLIGSDYVRGPLEQLAERMPDVPLLQFNLVDCPLPDDSVDALVLLNVLEHIEDDAAAVRQLYRILRPGGIAVIEVPAGPNLYDVYDKLLLHFRRYSSKALRHLIRGAGFRVVDQSHIGFFMYPGFWAVKQRNKRFLSEASVVQQQVVEQSIRETGGSRLLESIMSFEMRLGKMVSYPFGIRQVLTCVKGSC